jgi:hypothetical protein
MNELIEYYELVKRSYDVSNARLATAAFRSCGTCGSTIDTMGGPGSGSICMPCGDFIKSGQAKGCIVFDEVKT